MSYNIADSEQYKTKEMNVIKGSSYNNPYLNSYNDRIKEKKISLWVRKYRPSDKKHMPWQHYWLLVIPSLLPHFFIPNADMLYLCLYAALAILCFLAFNCNVLFRSKDPHIITKYKDLLFCTIILQILLLIHLNSAESDGAIANFIQSIVSYLSAGVGVIIPSVDNVDYKMAIFGFGGRTDVVKGALAIGFLMQPFYLLAWMPLFSRRTDSIGKMMFEQANRNKNGKLKLKVGCISIIIFCLLGFFDPGIYTGFSILNPFSYFETENANLFWYAIFMPFITIQLSFYVFRSLLAWRRFNRNNNNIIEKLNSDFKKGVLFQSGYKHH